eukprot:1731382-Amphidinium_carterae.1
MKQTSEMGKRTRWKLMRSPAGTAETLPSHPTAPMVDEGDDVDHDEQPHTTLQMIVVPPLSKSNLDHPHQIGYQRRGTDHPQWTSEDEVRKGRSP